MRPGYREILRNAEQEVDYTADYVKELSSVKETRQLWRAWSGFLDHYVRATSHLRRATDQGKSKGWSDRLLAEQRRDPFLQFAMQTRNSVCHSFVGKRETGPRAVSVADVFQLSGNSELTISRDAKLILNGRPVELPNGTVSIRDGRYSGGTIPETAINEHQHFIVLTEVRMRNGVCPVPNPKTDPSEQAIEVSNKVNDWLKVKLGEAREMAEEEGRGQK